MNHPILIKVKIKMYARGFVQPMVDLLMKRSSMFHEAVQVSNKDTVTAVGSGTEEEIAKLIHDLRDLYDFIVYDTCDVSVYM